MENNNNQQSFWQFSDQLRVHTNNLANLSLNDSIWGNSYPSKRPEERRNFDIRVGGELNSAKKESDLNGFNQNWKLGGSNFNGFNQNPKESSDFNQNWKVGGSDFNGFNQISKQESDFNQNWKVGGSNFNGFNLNSKEESDLNGFNQNWKLGGSDFNGFNQNWKVGESNFNGFNQNWKISGLNDGFNKGVYSKPSLNFNNNDFNLVVNTNKGNKDNIYSYGGKSGKKNKNNSNKDNNNNNNSDKNSVEKRFKTLPPAESLPRNEPVGGYIFVCNNETMEENLERQLFGLPPRYRDSVRAITPGLPLFLYNYSTHQLHGIFEAASFGASNIDPTAWEDKKNAGESRFPAQVRVVTRKICEPLEEDSFRPILHHYDGPKFRLELSIHEALSLLDIFANASLLDIFEESNP